MHNLHNVETWFNGNTPCHNDPTKKVCDHCMTCRPLNCDEHECDRAGRCMCNRTQCICLGRLT
ncbi:MAG: hypothetical protein WA144_08400 [Candidatus Methanoperedens sp.]